MNRSAMLTLLVTAMLSDITFGQSKLKPRSSLVVSESVRKEKPVPPPATLSPFHQISGTPFLMAKISVDIDKSASFPKNSASHGVRIHGGLRNVVFFDLRDDTSHALFPDHETLILSMVTLPEAKSIERGLRKTEGLELLAGGDEQSGESPGTPAARWQLVEYASRDTNGDGSISAKDANALGIADAGGNSFVEVIPQLGDVFARQMVDEDTLLLIHGSQAKQSAIRIHLPSRKIRSTKVLPNFGTR